MSGLNKKQRETISRAVKLGLFLPEDDRGRLFEYGVCKASMAYLGLDDSCSLYPSYPGREVLHRWLILLGEELVAERCINKPVIGEQDRCPYGRPIIDLAEWYYPIDVVLDGCEQFIRKEVARRARRKNG